MWYKIINLLKRYKKRGLNRLWFRPFFVQVYEVILPPPKLRELGEIQKMVIVNMRTATGWNIRTGNSEYENSNRKYQNSRVNMRTVRGNK